MATGLTFVSYSRADSEFALKLASDLRARGAEVWLDQLDIEAGSRWDTAIEGALQRSARLLVLLSPNSVGSQNVLDEVSFALDESKTVLPVLVAPCAIPMRMRRLQHVDFTRGYEAGLTRLLGALGVAPPAVPPEPPPFERPDAPAEPPVTPRTPPEPEMVPASLSEIYGATPAPSRMSPGSRLSAVVGLIVATLVVVWYTSSGSSAPETSPEPAAVTAENPTQAADTHAPSATPPADAPAPAPADTGSAPPRPPSTSTEALLQRLTSGAATRTERRSDDADLDALRTLTRALSTRATLANRDLEQVTDAQFAACAGQGPSSPCGSTAQDLVDSLLTTVCRRQTGPPPDSREATVLSWEIKEGQCRQAYLNVILTLMDLRAKDAIRSIKAG